MASSRGLLPSPPRLVADLVRSIGAIVADDYDMDMDDDERREPADSNALARVPAGQRPLLAALHVLFPAVLLPALDLLDRRRVVRYGAAAPTTASTGEAGSLYSLYQVLGDTPHVVHLRAWHCTCAYFAMRAAGTDAAEDADGEHGRNDSADQNDQNGQHAVADNNTARFSVPPCRHLLACLLVEQWPALRAHALAIDSCGPEVLAGVAAGVH